MYDITGIYIYHTINMYTISILIQNVGYENALANENVKQTSPLSTVVTCTQVKNAIRPLEMITYTNEHDVRLPSFFAVWLETKSGQSLQVVCFDPDLQILFLRHHQVADIGLLDWVMFSGVLLPVYPCKYPTDSSATARPPVFN